MKLQVILKPKNSFLSYLICDLQQPNYSTLVAHIERIQYKNFEWRTIAELLILIFVPEHFFFIVVTCIVCVAIMFIVERINFFCSRGEAVMCACVCSFLLFDLAGEQDVIEFEQLRTTQKWLTEKSNWLHLFRAIQYFSKEISHCWKWIISICLMTFGLFQFCTSVPLCVFSEFAQYNEKKMYFDRFSSC